MPSISVCMIVKNEEKVLPRCLSCLAGIADEIIVVDTGSSDGTKAAAKLYTEKIYDFKWNGDFSAARNFAFSKASMDFIYSADADEMIDSDNILKFKKLKQSMPENTDIVQMKYKNQLSQNTTYNFDTEYRPKLFRRLRTFRWAYPVHEQVMLEPCVLNSSIEIIHMPQSSHAKRDFSVFEHAEKPLCPHLHRMYARELFIAGSDGDFFNAYQYFESTLHDEKLSLGDARASQCVVVKCAAIRRDKEMFFKTALKNAVGEPSAEVCCELGRYYFSEKDYEEAALWYYTAAFGAKCELNIRYCGSIPLKGLSESYAALGLCAQAQKYAGMAEKWLPPKSPDETQPHAADKS